MKLRKLLWTYGPTFRWRSFRLHGEPPNGRWTPLRVTQIVGGRRWSAGVIRIGPIQDDDADALRDASKRLNLRVEALRRESKARGGLPALDELVPGLLAATDTLAEMLGLDPEAGER